MKTDPLIDEIRRVRHQISAEYGHDPKRYLEHLREYEKSLRRSGKFRFIKSRKKGKAARVS